MDIEWTTPTGRTVTVTEGDITRVPAGAIANAANSALAGGGGVDGAIHRAGGPEIMRELRQIGRCPTGDAVVTGAGKLPAQFVFHAVGPVYRDGRQGEPELLASCYRKCLALAEARKVESISFPAISTGVYGYPLREATGIAVREVLAHLARPDRTVQHVIFVPFGKDAYETYVAVLKEQAGKPRG